MFFLPLGKRFLFLLWCCGGLMPCFAQNKLTIHQRDSITLPYRVVLQNQVKDSLESLAILQHYLQKQIAQGFIEIKQEAGKDWRMVYLTLGMRHTWAQVGKGNSPIKAAHWKNKPFSVTAIQQYQQKVLQYAENMGYPFAQVRLDSLQVQAGKWQGVWQYEPRMLVTFDSVLVVGKVKVRSQFLQQYLRIVHGQPYTQQKVNSIRARLQNLPYLRLERTPEVRFMAQKAIIQLPLTAVKANQIDGIVGILPNENQRGQILFTGELNGQFYNVLAQGHSFKLQWQRLQSLSQRLEIGTTFQSLFQTPFQLQGNFNFLKQDSSFANQQWEIRLGYTTQSNSDFFAQIIHQKSNLGDAANLYEGKKIPTISETKWQGYGVGYKIQTLDDVFFPRKGGQIVLSIYTGRKSIIKNPFLPDSIYNGINLSTLQTLWHGEVQHYFRVGKGVLRLAAQGKYMANQQLFLNELMRLGGLTTLRGHNQNAFYASQYALGSIEFRLPLDAGSYIFTFYEQAYLESRVVGNFQADSPAGIGIGANLSLRAGVFSVAYALGRSQQNPSFAFNRSKIHFGVVNRF